MQSILKNKWMVSIDADWTRHHHEIKEEIKSIKQLARCNEIYLQFDEETQTAIQLELKKLLVAEERFRSSSSNARGASPQHWIYPIMHIFYDYFGIHFESQLMIWKSDREKGVLTLWRAFPNIKYDNVDADIAMYLGRLRFRARTVPRLDQQKDITKKLIKEKCTEKEILLGHGYCKNNAKENGFIIPEPLIRIIIWYSKKDNILIINDTKKLFTEICEPNAELLADGYCRNYMKENNVHIPIYLIQIIVRYFNVTFDHLNKLLVDY